MGAVGVREIVRQLTSLRCGPGGGRIQDFCKALLHTVILPQFLKTGAGDRLAFLFVGDVVANQIG